MKIWFIRLICAAMRAYFRFVPFSAGKRPIWNHIVRPYILWRSLPIQAMTKFNARIDGDLLDVIHNHLYFFGVWEPGITWLYRQHLRPGDVCIDIGANIGAHTLLAAHLVGVHGQVHAIEASPTIYRRLLSNLKLNGYPQVQPYNVAVTGSMEPVTIFLHDARNLGATTIMVAEAHNRTTTTEVVIEGRPLSAIVPVEQLKLARLIKIDVEGAEWLVLQGMKDILHLLRPDCLILVEVSREALSAHGIGIDDVVALLDEHGWKPFEVANSYAPDFYFKPPGKVLDPDIRFHAPLLDIGFARPDVRATLLHGGRR